MISASQKVVRKTFSQITTKILPINIRMFTLKSVQNCPLLFLISISSIISNWFSFPSIHNANRKVNWKRNMLKIQRCQIWDPHLSLQPENKTKQPKRLKLSYLCISVRYIALTFCVLRSPMPLSSLQHRTLQRIIQLSKLKEKCYIFTSCLLLWHRNMSIIVLRKGSPYIRVHFLTKLKYFPNSIF